MCMDGGPRGQGPFKASWKGAKGAQGPWAPGETCDVFQAQWLRLSGWSGVSDPPVIHMGQGPLSRGNKD